MFSAADDEDSHTVRSLRELEHRIARLEAHLGLPPPEPVRPAEEAGRESASPDAGGSGLEQGIGEAGLAWLGGAVLLLGMVFLAVYITGQGHPMPAAALGFSAAVGLNELGRRIRAAHFSRALQAVGLLLLWHTALRLHFFTPWPLVGDRRAAAALLFLVLAWHFWIAILRNLQWLAGLALALCFVSALLADSARASLLLVAATSLFAVALAERRRWWAILPLSAALAYGAHLEWLVGNPLVGHPLGAGAAQRGSLAYPFFYAAVYAWPAFGLRAGAEHAAARMSVLVLNCLGFSTAAALTVFTYWRADYAGISSGIAAFFLGLSMLQWLRLRAPFVPSLHACFGYLALSIAIHGYAGFPAGFLWLSLQSLLVLSMALWFRSKFLVVANFLIYLGILAVYAASGRQTNMANFSFALAALASARVMNWQKARLALRTEAMRNLYLAVAFVLVLYSLYRALPPSYVALSWTAAAACYFLLSLLLHNIKYRWMAMFQLAATVFHLFAVDLGHLDQRFRVATFLFLGTIALAISLSYTRLRRIVSRHGGRGGRAAL